MKGPVTFLGILAAGALAACDQPAATAVEPSATASPAALTDVQKRVAALPEGQLNGVLFRAIRDGGAACQSVAEALPQRDAAGAPRYAARCADGPIYLVDIGPDGTARVLGPVPASAGRGS